MGKLFGSKLLTIEILTLSLKHSYNRGWPMAKSDKKEKQKMTVLILFERKWQ